jgi:hypothetical protein
MRRGSRYQFNFVRQEYKNNFHKLSIDSALSMQALIERALIMTYPEVFGADEQTVNFVRNVMKMGK